MVVGLACLLFSWETHIYVFVVFLLTGVSVYPVTAQKENYFTKKKLFNEILQTVTNSFTNS